MAEITAEFLNVHGYAHAPTIIGRSSTVATEQEREATLQKLLDEREECCERFGRAAQAWQVGAQDATMMEQAAVHAEQARQKIIALIIPTI